jgi:hypothetical protein
MPDRTEKTTTKTDYNQSQDQVSQSRDVSSQTGNRQSSGVSSSSSEQQGVQREFVNKGVMISFSVKIKGGFPNLPGGC